MNKTLLLTLALLTAVPCFAADKEVEELLAAMRKAYKETKTAAYTMEATILGQNGDMTVTMKGGFKNPNLIYVDIDAEEGSAKVVSDGTKIYASSDELARSITLPYSHENLGRVLAVANLEILCFFDWQKQLSTDTGNNMHDSKLSLRRSEKWNGRTWIVLEEAAPTVGVYVEYFIDPDTKLIWRTVQMSLDKEFVRGDYVIKSLKTGVKISESRFKKPVIA